MPDNINLMARSARGISRRSVLGSGLAAVRLLAVGGKGTPFPSDWKRYADPTTEMEVLRLTDPAYTSTLPAYYNRAIARNSSWPAGAILECRRELYTETAVSLPSTVRLQYPWRPEAVPLECA